MVVALATLSCGTSGGSSTPDAAPPGGGDAGPRDATGGVVDGATGADATSPADGGGPGLGALSDTFDGTALSSAWTVLQPSAVTASVHDGALYLQPTRSVLWFNASQGILVFKRVTGSFKGTTTVHARLASNPMLPPNQNIHLGGVMARSGSGSSENYVLDVIGQAEMGHLAIEWKSTTDSVSAYAESPWMTADADLRVCRVGSIVQAFGRAVGTQAWSMVASYDRPDLPAELEVGPTCYANSTPPDLIAYYDDFVFADVADVSQCGQN